MRLTTEVYPANAGHTHNPTRLEQGRNPKTHERHDSLPLCSPTSADLGRVIRQLRRKRKLTIEDLAFASGVHPTYVSGIERGTRNPSWEKACALAHGLGITIAYLSTRTESAARIREGTEDVLQEERARLARQPPDWAQADAA
jgi:transcriptional regulator with XRE-family HTH domain